MVRLGQQRVQRVAGLQLGAGLQTACLAAQRRHHVRGDVDLHRDLRVRAGRYMYGDLRQDVVVGGRGLDGLRGGGAVPAGRLVPRSLALVGPRVFPKVVLAIETFPALCAHFSLDSRVDDGVEVEMFPPLESLATDIAHKRPLWVVTELMPLQMLLAF